MTAKLVFVLALSAATARAAEQREASNAVANPIRKVVTMLQMMQKKVQDEGEKEAKLFDKYMCWCKTGGGDLEKSIAGANTKVPELQSSIEEAEAQSAQLKEDLAAHTADRVAAGKAMAEATALRGNEAAAFASFKAESDSNIDALAKAVAAIEKGMAGSFLQTGAAQVLRKMLLASEGALANDRQEVLAFLSNTQGNEYAPQAGQITGILKTMHDELSADNADAVAAEEASIKAYDGLMAAKKKEVAALTKMIQEKLERQAALGVNIAEMKTDLTDTEEALVEDTKFLANLEANCAAKEKEWAERSKTRAEELVALAETIKVLNDDGALELFKQTLPSASASLLQVQAGTASLRSQALAMIRAAQGPGRQQLDFIALALHGSKIGFGKVIKMIDDMIATLKVEQQDDDNKKEYCSKQLDESDDKKKGLERSVSDLETAIADTEEGIAALKESIAALQAGISALDKSVAEATEQRKEEHEDFTGLLAQDSAAKEVLNYAKNRLNKFYNPKLYKAPPKRELSEEDRITVNMGGTLAPTAAPGGIAGTGIATLAQVSVHKDAPPPPPETFGAYAKKTGESGGVIQMIDLLIADLDKEMTEAKAEEKDAQSDYEQLMSGSAEKRGSDSKSLGEQEAAKADAEAALQTHTSDKTSTEKELAATLQYIHSLHGSCDWLVQYFDTRKEARASEVDSLGNAKAVLSGADYSLVQTGAAKSLRTAAR